MPEHTVKVTYTDDLVRFAAGRYWRKTIATSGFVITVVLPLLFVLMVVLGYPAWALGFFAGLVGVWGLLLFVSYFQTRKRSLTIFRRMKDKTAIFTFSETGFRAVSDAGDTTLAWKMFDEIIEYPNVWLLSIANSTYMTLPTATLDDETKAFIRDHVGKE